MNRMETEGKTGFNSHTMMNPNEILEMLISEDTSGLKAIMIEMIDNENRQNVLSDQEMLQATSAILYDLSVTTQNPLTDKMTRIFWNATSKILKNHGVIE